MDKLFSFIMMLVFATVLTMVAGFVVSSIEAYEFSFVDAIPYGIGIGILTFILGSVIMAIAPAPEGEERT